MKKLILILTILSVSFVNAQAFKGKGDSKFQVGANFQNSTTGLNVSYDYGVGENISLGLSSTYALGISNDINADFGDRIDLKARFNANLGNVVNIDENFDIYPGLDFSLKNFGGHLGARYFFTDGFGLYTELNAPFAKYNSDVLTPAEKIHNQFTVNIGATFNL
jgi:outer membrane protein G